MSEITLLVFRIICAFISDDGYSHFTYSNINISHIGLNRIRHSLSELESSHQIKNCTINGYYPRYLINSPIECPEFIFNPNLPLRHKLFMCHYLDNFDEFSYKTYSELESLDSYYHSSTANILSDIKKILGQDMYSYLSNTRYCHMHPYHEKYQLIKTDNGYQVDSTGMANYKKKLSEEELKRFDKVKYLNRNQRIIEEKGIGHYLMLKLKNRISNDKDRFTDVDVDEDYLNKLFKEQNGCDFYTGLPFDDLTQVSIDRVNSSKSYIKDNIVLTTNLINRMKNDSSLEEFLILCNTISKHFPIIGIK